ncbi:minor tail protein [Streptomyces phage JustBecause]|nr:minor tail protein [Streptomyces phage JustBecause]
MATAYKINGFTIGGNAVNAGIYLLEGTEYAPALAPRRAVIEIPGVHYAIPQWNDPLSQITVSLRVRLVDGDAESLASRWNTLMGLLGMGTNQPITLTRVRGTIEETADAQLVSMNTPDFSCPGSRADATLIFSIPGGAWRGAETTVTFFNSASNTLANALASTVPIADALLLLKGPATSLTVTDNTSTTTIFWGDGSSSVSAAQWLLIDPRYMRARLQSSETWSFTTGINVTGALEFRGNGPLTFTSRGSGAFGNRTGTFTVTTAGGNNGVQVRSRYAVV